MNHINLNSNVFLMNRTISSVTLIFSLAFFISCSGSANITEEGEGRKGSLKYPSWYPQQSVVSTDSVIYAYAAAIDDDSAEAVSKAVDWAESELRSSVAYSLENIRNEALAEFGNGSELDSESFILALRKADGIVNNLTSMVNTKVETVDGFESYRSFAKVAVPKEELVKGVGERLEAYEKAWNLMKESQAFQTF